jgi:endonuclease YncB( thermonuclease family)
LVNAGKSRIAMAKRGLVYWFGPLAVGLLGAITAGTAGPMVAAHLHRPSAASLPTPATDAGAFATFTLRGAVATDRLRSMPLHLTPPYWAPDATTLVSPTGVARLAGVSGLAADTLCVDDGHLRFACGLMGRASLLNTVGVAPVACVPRRDAPGNVTYTCTMNGTDLGAVQVSRGFARATTTSGTYAGLEAQAKVDNAGAWNGGWTIWHPAPSPPLVSELAPPRVPAGSH